MKARKRVNLACRLHHRSYPNSNNYRQYRESFRGRRDWRKHMYMTRPT